MKKITQNMLAELFTTKKVNGDDRIVYNNKYLAAADGTAEHELYEIVSDCAMALGVTHGFSYEIVSRAVDVLAEAYANTDDIEDVNVDMLHEDIDAIVPVYNHTLLLIANPGDYHHIDEAREVYGNDVDTIRGCAIAWYSLIDMAAREIHDAIVEYNEQ